MTASGGYGIDLSGDNALVTNRAGGTIVGSSYGVRLQSANGIVVNHGSLSGGTGAVVRHPNPAMVWPVRACAGALGEGIPARDLLLSPEHAVFLDNVLVPVGLLVNGRTVVQEPCAAITYFHIELPQHDLVVAEGAACESYLDTLNRADFENAGTVITVHPEFTTETANEIWLARACAPQCRSGPALDIIRHRLELRADDAGRMTGSTRAAMA